MDILRERPRRLYNHTRDPLHNIPKFTFSTDGQPKIADV
jgi:hypothetical protein